MASASDRDARAIYVFWFLQYIGKARGYFPLCWVCENREGLADNLLDMTNCQSIVGYKPDVTVWKEKMVLKNKSIGKRIEKNNISRQKGSSKFYIY